MSVSEVISRAFLPLEELSRTDVLIALAEGLVASILIFFALSPDWYRIIFKKMTDVDLATTSDIPGNPHVIDFSMISALRTLPEPNNFNMVVTKVPYDRDVLIEGYMPPARMFSVSAYNQGGSVPESVKMDNRFQKSLQQQFYRIVLTKSPEKFKGSTEYDLVVFTHEWKCGMVVIRNYMVPAGTTVYTPVFSNLESGEVIRPSRKLVAGPTNLHVNYSSYVFHQVSMVASHLLAVYALNIIFVLNKPDSFWPLNVLFTAFALSFLRGVYWLLYRIGRRRVKEIFHKGAPDLHTIKLVDVEGKAHDSAPSKLHRYYLMRYDIPLGQELKVKFKINDNHQDYWSFICYDLYGIPLPTFAYDGNVHRENLSSDGSYDVTLYLVNRGKSKLITRGAQHSAGSRNEVDVSSSPQGNILFRLVHPKSEAFVALAKPELFDVEPILSSAEKKDQ